VSSSLPAGFIATRWSAPSAIIAGGEVVGVPNANFRVNVTHVENEETFVDVFNVTDTSIILSRNRFYKTRFRPQKFL
jgi:hypothetical protein